MHSGKIGTRFLAILLVGIPLFFGGCLFGGGGQEGAEPTKEGVVIRNYDSSKREMEEVFDRVPERTIAVWQNNVETILALGAGDALIGAFGIPYPECLREEYREAYARIPFRQMHMPGLENLILMEPDFIAAWASTFSERGIRTTDFWQRRGVRTYISESTMGRKTGTIAGEYRYIQDLGRIFHREQRAACLIEEMKAEIARVQEETKGRKKPKTLILEKAGREFMAYGKGMLAADILEHVHGETVPLDLYIGYEQVIRQNPEVVFLIVSEWNYKEADTILQAFLHDPVLQNVQAVQNKRVYVLPLYMVYASATRTLDGIRAMAKGLYPDLYGGAER